MLEKEEILAYLEENGILEKDLTEKQILKILRNMIEKNKIDIDCLDMIYQNNPGKLTTEEYVNGLNKIELQKIKTQSYLFQAQQLQKKAQKLKRKETVEKIKKIIKGR